MLKNNNLKICRKLVWREFRFHKGSTILLALAITLVCALSTFAFALGGMVHNGFIYNYQLAYGSTSHILYYGLTNQQADALADHAAVQSSVRLTSIGVLSDDMMEYRNVKLSIADADWADSVEAVPTYGRMPQAPGEVALDEITMNSLAIPHELGTEIQLRWTPIDGSGERIDTFRLCGWWNSVMSITEACAWITADTAQSLSSEMPDLVTLGVKLYRPDHIEEQAEALLSELGLGSVMFTANLANLDARMDSANDEAIPYYMINLAVVLCGILMVYNITQISTEQNVRFYGRVKSLGMTPRQLRRLLLERVNALCLIAIPLGWLLGIVLELLLSPLIVVGMDGQNPGIYFFRFWPLAASGILTWLTTLLAGALPARKIAKISPAQAMQYVDVKLPRTREHRGSFHRRTTIISMALSGLQRNRGRTILAGASLFVSLAMMCGAWTQYVSYDQEKYIAGMAVTDYQIADASAAMPYQRYNPHSHSITQEMVEQLVSHPAVAELGIIRTMEVNMTAGEEERAPIVETFETVDESGTPRKAVMERYPDWMAGYEMLRETGAYIGIIMGMDGLALDAALSVTEYNDGSFDPTLFATGNYVIAAGADAVGIITTPPVGSHVTIGNRDFTIMASVPAQNTLVSGTNSRQAQFNVSYYMPAEVYDTLFPDSGIRNVVINIDHSQQKEFETFLSGVLEGSYASVATRSDYQWNFENARFRQQLVSIMVALVLLIIGVLNFCNALVTKTLVRKKELAVYESLGMTRRQIKRLLLAEGLLYGGSLLVLLIPTVSAAVWAYTQHWLANTNTWCVTYHFSLTPMWLTLPILLMLSVVLPLACLRFIMRESVTERLRILE